MAGTANLKNFKDSGGETVKTSKARKSNPH
jgi:hypothetical protein